jgi:hypothetical protein
VGSRKFVTFVLVGHVIGVVVLMGAVVPILFAAIEHRSTGIWLAFGLVVLGLAYNVLGLGYYGREFARLSDGRRRRSL